MNTFLVTISNEHEDEAGTCSKPLTRQEILLFQKGLTSAHSKLQA
jgi:hypothetical protein